MAKVDEILKKYWGFDSFREPQKEIITSVLEKNNVITLLPTGSGKSLCYQIPGVLLDGVCLVVSPLLALMEDQVKSLENKNIKATYLKPNSNEEAIIQLFDNLKFGNYKFLYLSPERLQSNLIQQKLQELNISLIAIDEAHCISEWGHDFRPSYRNIKIILEQHKQANCIALTATATKKVILDIEKNLTLSNTKVFKKSFYKSNLAYQVFTVEDKLTKLKQIFTKTKTPAIVYVNSRKKTEEISNFLNANTFKSSFYHAGLSANDKQEAFKSWMTEETPIMVATNAFGMGIDKANVGIVVHFDIPNSIENYVQEAGRAGRSLKKSFAVLFKNKHDITLLKERFNSSIPTIKEIKLIYRKLHQHFTIANGELSDEVYYFNVNEFSIKYNFYKNIVVSTLKILVNNGIISLNSNFEKKSSLQFNVSSKVALCYSKNNKSLSNFIETLLRSYSSLNSQKVKINEYWLAKKNNSTSSQIKVFLKQLHKDEIAVYDPVNKDAELQFLYPREDDRTINLFTKDIIQFLHQKKRKFQDFINYLENDTVCRSIQLLNYFDEKSTIKCGICDVCLLTNSKSSKNLNESILNLLQKEALSSSEIISTLNKPKDEVLILLRNMLAESIIKINHQNKYQLN
ncbi:MAG: RecQ family ATP-dependent DNA helicase [Flavobacteriaceae bacterium]|nr:RecQ family ATP-dependent DNA helicase [Flavobacteriaceae bacterium]